MNTDQLLNRKYNSANYNCAHFVCEAWRVITGCDISSDLQTFLLPVKGRTTPMQLRRKFERLPAPQSPCIVLMKRHRCQPHVGIFLNGRIFHIRETGVELQKPEVAFLGFNSIGYFKC